MQQVTVVAIVTYQEKPREEVSIRRGPRQERLERRAGSDRSVQAASLCCRCLSLLNTTSGSIDGATRRGSAEQQAGRAVGSADGMARPYFASGVIPDLRRAAWQAERAINPIATRRARILAIEFDKTDVVGADHRRELRNFLRGMNEGERVTAIMSVRAFFEAACELPAMLAGLGEEVRGELKRRVAIEQHPQEVAYCDESEEAVRVVNAAITMVAAALQSAAGFEGNDQAFDKWMTASSVGVEREIEAEKRKAGAPTTAAASSDVDYAAKARRDVDRIFREAFPTIFKSAA